MATIYTQPSRSSSTVSSVDVDVGGSVTLYLYGSDVSLYGYGNCSSGDSSVADATMGSVTNSSFIEFTVHGYDDGTTTLTLYVGPTTSVQDRIARLTVHVGDGGSDPQPGPVSISGPSSIDLAESSGPWVYTASAPDTDSADWSFTESGAYVNDWGAEGGTLTINDIDGTGSFTIHYTDSTGSTGSKTVTVIDSSTIPIPIQSITLEQTSITVTRGVQATAYATYTPTDATDFALRSSIGSGNEISFGFARDLSTPGRLRIIINTSSSLTPEGATYTTYFYLQSNPSVRTGNLTIHVADGGTDPDEPVLVNSIEIDGPLEVEVGSSEEYVADVSPADADDDRVSWSVVSGPARVEDSDSSSCTLYFYEVGEVQLRATARDGGGARETITIQAKLPVFTLIGAGGTFPTGQSSVTITAQDIDYILPDWSVVDRPGYRLSYWQGASHGRGEMGEKVRGGDTWTAHWVADSRDYSTEYLPHAAIRIYRTLTQYIDATYLQILGGEAVVDLAENEEGSATFTLINDYEKSGHNIMADDCDLWSSGSEGPIRPGMYVRIDDIQSDGTLRYVMDGFISTISPDAEKVQVEVANRMTFLGKQGTTIRRNYYGGTGSRDSMMVSAVNDPSYGLCADLSELPDGAVLDGPVFWTVPVQKAYSGTQEDYGLNEVAGEALFEWTFPVEDGSTKVGPITVPMHLGLFGTGEDVTFDATLTSTGGQSYSATVSVSDVNGDFDVTFDFGIVDVSGTARLTVHASDYSGDMELRAVTRAQSSGDCTLSRWYGSGSSRRWSTTTQDLITTLTFYQLAEAEGTIRGDLFDVSSIPDAGVRLDDSSLYTPSANRAQVAYIIEGIQTTVDVMEGIAWAMGMTPMTDGSVLPASETMVSIFRTGGGYALDYLQKLADIAAESGRMRSFLCRGFTTPVLAIGARYIKGDTRKTTIRYGGDSASGSSIAFSAFTPSLTLKNRPSLATLRGTISEKGSSESVPLQIAVEDVDSTETRYGILVETVVSDSSVSSMGDAGSAAWGTLASSELDQWEGNVTVPDIHMELFEIAGAHPGSGVPIALTDTRNGFSSYAARVRQIKLDYNSCTTALTISNYSLRYSSGISDTQALAITSADVATGDNSTTLFNSQYARIKTDQDLNIGDGTSVTVRGLDGELETAFTFDDVSVFFLPSGRHLIHAVALESNNGHVDDDQVYGVYGVSVGSVKMEFRRAIRPDYYDGQTLSVDIDCP